MAVSVISPGWKPQKQKVDPLDQVLKGLQIAQAGFGIYADYEKINQAKALQEQAQEKQVKEDETRELTNEKIKAETKALAKDKQPTSGSVRDVKYMLGGKAYMTTLGPNDRLPEGATPYEEPKEPKAFNEYEDSTSKIKREAFTNFDKATEKYKDAYFKGKNVESLLDLGTPTAVNAASTQFMKLSGEVGAITDSDIKRFGGSPDLMSRAKRLFSENIEGAKTPEDIKAMRDAARILTEKNRSAFLSEAENIADRTARSYRSVNRDDIKFALGADQILKRLDEGIYEESKAFAQTGPQQSGLRPTVPAKQFYSPQGAPFAQQQRYQQVQQSWGSRLGTEAQAGPSAPTPFNPDEYIKRGR